ncbi:MAG: hypothetical protein ACPG06_02240, partial [Alphaproteobacteria bacterium]
GHDASDYAGNAIAAAGDVNGDGFEDILVGARKAPAGDGEAYLIFGGSNAPGAIDGTGRQILDLSFLDGADGFALQGESGKIQFGSSVAGLGDFNGDGLADFSIGHPRVNGEKGVAHIIFGASQFATQNDDLDGFTRQLMDVTALDATQGLIIQGQDFGERAGWDVAGAGDVNGDGLADLIVGRTESAGIEGSFVSIVYGSASPLGQDNGNGQQVLDLASLTGQEGFKIQGSTLSEKIGKAVGGAGDVNGDGFDDVVVSSATVYTSHTAGESETYVVFGGARNAAGASPIIDTENLAPSDGFVIADGSAISNQGFDVAVAGDINGDGFADIIVGAPSDINNADEPGASYVLFGKADGFGAVDQTGRRVVDLATLNPADGFMVLGEAAGDRTGIAVASAGDVNGDSFDDLLIGAYKAFTGSYFTGQAFLLFGGDGSFGTVGTDGRAQFDANSINGVNGIVINGDVPFGRLGIAVEGVGDINSDGFDDFAIGDIRGDGGGNRAGQTTVIFGSSFAANGAVVNAAGTAAADILHGSFENDMLDGAGGADVLRGGAGNDVLTVADLDFLTIDGGRGIDTLALSGSNQVLDLRQVSAATINGIEVIDLGDGNNTLSLTALNVTNFVTARTEGKAVLRVDGDNGALALAGPGWEKIAAIVDEGITYSRFMNGRAEVQVALSVAKITSLIDVFDLTSEQGFVISGRAGNSNATGTSVAGLGDLNGDGLSDILIGAPFEQNDDPRDGVSYVIFGSTTSFGSLDSQGRDLLGVENITDAKGFSIGGDVANQRSGETVAGAGDINGDGLADLLVGAPIGDATKAGLVFGGSDPIGDLDGAGVTRRLSMGDATADEAQFITSDTGRTETGEGLAGVGDINGDGFDDFAIGAPLKDGGGFRNGEVNILFGEEDGLGNSSSDFGSQGVVFTGLAQQDYAGTSIAGIGDVNGDGVDDFIIGAPNADVNGAEAGDAYVLFGNGDGFNGVGLDSLNGLYGFVVGGHHAGDMAGASLGGGGDFNGDGLDDFIIGAPYGDAGGTGDVTGEAYIVFGTDQNFDLSGTGRSELGLGTLGETSGLVLRGQAIDGELGAAVADAGDVNGDGYDDFIIGAPGASKAYVLYGSADPLGDLENGRRVLDLDTLTVEQGLVLHGQDGATQFGGAVDGAGDVNGDGFADVIIGARFGSVSGANSGDAYVIYGSAAGAGDKSVIAVGSQAAEKFIGGIGDDLLQGGGGADVLRAGAGDDVIVVPDLDFFRIDGGTGFDVLRLDDIGEALFDFGDLRIALEDIEAFDLRGDEANTLSILRGRDVSSLSASTNELVIFGDGNDIVELGGDFVDGPTGVERDGLLFNSFSSLNTKLLIQQDVTIVNAVIDLAVLSPTKGFVIQGDVAGDLAGWDVSGGGDVNGDGIADVIIGASGGDDGGESAGEAYVVFGKRGGFGVDVNGRQVIDLTDLGVNEGFIIQGDEDGGDAGLSVSFAGDVNGDGFDDVLVGVPLVENTAGNRVGKAAVIFGSDQGFGAPDVAQRQVIDLAQLSEAQGFFIVQDSADEEELGHSVEAAGDVNNDGLADIIVGHGEYFTAGRSTDAHVIFGTTQGFGDLVAGTDRREVDLANLDANDGFTIRGSQRTDGGGTTVSSAGDINGDGIDDLIVGAPNAEYDSENAGQAYVVFGTNTGSNVNIDLDTLLPSQGFVILGASDHDRLGGAVSAAGDVNGDGYEDLIVGAPVGDLGAANAGEAYVVFGKEGTFGTNIGGRQFVDLSQLQAADGFIIQGDDTGDYAGSSVSSAGDVNGDGYDDLIIGAEHGDDGGQRAGEAYIVFGSGDPFGADVSGRQIVDLTDLDPDKGFTVIGAQEFDIAGRSVSAAGDINDDGFDDLIIGALGNDDGGAAAGAAYVVFGGVSKDISAVTTQGTAAVETLIGSAVNDTLSGNGGADVIRSGAGDDLLAIGDLDFFRIDGGNGLDTLAIDDIGAAEFDFSALEARLESIEHFDMSGDEANTLNIQDGSAVRRVADNDSLLILGDAGDQVKLGPAFSLITANDTSGATPVDIYGDGSVFLRIDTDINVM